MSAHFLNFKCEVTTNYYFKKMYALIFVTRLKAGSFVFVRNFWNSVSIGKHVA